MEVELRRTTIDDLPYVFSAERHDDNRHFINVWPEEKHREALCDEDIEHLIIESKPLGQYTGFVILAGLKSENRSIEFMRIVAARISRGDIGPDLNIRNASMHPTAQKVVDAAHNLGLAIEIQEFAGSTRTAEEAAHAVGCMVAQIVKSLLFIVGPQPTMVLVSGSNRLDERKLAHLCGVGRKQVKRGTADMARDVTGFAIGGVPPFGHASLLPTFIDADLQQFDTIWAAAGTPQAVFAITPQDLVNATHGMVADLKA